MYFIALLVFAAVAAANRLPFDTTLDIHWTNFKKVYGKSYEGREEGARRLIWEGHVNNILQHNLAADMGFHSFQRGINEYSDLTHEEFLRRMTGLTSSHRLRNNGSTWLPPSNVEFPERVDWREGGLVTPVKNQADCGSCWAFSTTGSLEGQHKKKTGRLVSLSEQNLIDCAKSEGTQGCEGGDMDDAFIYIQQNNGIDTEDAYPYTAKVGECRFRKEKIGATCSGFVDVPVDDEVALMKAVATVGPISAGIDASRLSFQTYRSGIYDDITCNKNKLNHGILIVGYGTDDGKDYWLVKNSWGESWGLNGYIKMARNQMNLCGIASMASYPLV